MNKKSKEDHSVTVALPKWVPAFLKKNPTHFDSIEDRMKFVIELARNNIDHQTGGPFGAAIFESASGKLISVGVNRVVPENCSVAHAEMMAIMLAQKKLGTFSLAGHQLVTSAQMCAMCCGAVPWSGVDSVVYGASAEMTEKFTGFDEGCIPRDWCKQLEKRGIKVTGGVLEKEAGEVLKAYTANKGVVYNGRP